VHLTKKTKRKNAQNCQDGRIKYNSLTHQTCSKQNEKKNMQQPVQPDFVLPSGYKLPKLDFLEVGVFLEAISKYYSVPFFVN